MAAGTTTWKSGLAALTWTHFMNDGLANFLPGILPFLAVDRHMPLPLVGSLMTALLLAQTLQPLSGLWADHLGGRRLILGGVLLTALGALLLSIFHRPLVMIIVLILTGLGNTLFHPQALSQARKLATVHPGLFMSVFLVGGELGRALSPAAAGYLVGHMGLTALSLMALPLLVSLPALFRYIPLGTSLHKARSATFHWRGHGRRAGWLIGFSSVRSATIYEIVTLSPIVWHARGGSLVSAASLVTVFIGVGIAGNLYGGYLSAKTGRRPIVWVTTVLAAVALALYIALPQAYLWLILSVLGVALFGTSSLTMLMGQDIFPDNPAMGSGVALGLANGLGALMVMPLTAMAGHTHPLAPIWCLLVLTVFSLIAVPRLPESRAWAA
ncbi:MFS transporter [Sulfobacillus sp. hq2]|uniref:MFS transporter n=1 Tax=Sulfobacillus sp. hq2 TaxID=2039167 RepID=UPI000CD15493|nr:MFS transporter [Sulfobacillus sp. hq2]POB10377.1 MFS transporter [Sulfobacillus sp. hq2]